MFLDLMGIDSLVGTRVVSCRCDDSRDSVMYGRATRASITVVSEFPAHARTADTRRSSRIFFERLGTRLSSYMLVSVVSISIDGV